MRVPSVSRVNTRQQQSPNTPQNAVNAVTGKSSASGSFEECLRSFYQQKDPQKKARPPDYKPEEAYITDPAIETPLPESDSNYIDIKR